MNSFSFGLCAIRIFLLSPSPSSRGRLFTSRNRRRPSWTASEKCSTMPSLWSSWRLRTLACSTASPRPTDCPRGACALAQVRASILQKHTRALFFLTQVQAWTVGLITPLKTTWNIVTKHDSIHLHVHHSHDLPPHAHAKTRITNIILAARSHIHRCLRSAEDGSHVDTVTGCDLTKYLKINSE